jgi:hypothetical protein
MSPKRNRKGENSRRRKRTLLRKAYEYGELSGADIALFIYQSGCWFTVYTDLLTDNHSPNYGNRL